MPAKKKQKPEATPEMKAKARAAQLDVVDLLEEQCTRAQNAVVDLEGSLNPQIDANPEDKLLMEMLDLITDAGELLQDLRDLLTTMRQRDERDQVT